MDKYLKSTKYINWQDQHILRQAKALSKGLEQPEQIAKKCFEFVRDEIKHSGDYKLNPVTVKASDVLNYGTGYCYSKSHLLTALLRANEIPAGLCYQRLKIPEQSGFYLHSLNAVYFKMFDWYRIDARGDQQDMTSDFCPPIERLPYTNLEQGEVDLVKIWSDPLTSIIKTLENSRNYQDVLDNLPDLEL